MCRSPVKYMKTLAIALSGKLLSGWNSHGLHFGLAAPALAAPKKVLVVTVTLGFPSQLNSNRREGAGQAGRETGAFTVDYAASSRMTRNQR